MYDSCRVWQLASFTSRLFEPQPRDAKLIRCFQNDREKALQSQPVVLRLEQASESPRGLVKFHFLIQGGAQESASLTHSQEMLVLPAPRAYLEDHWARHRRKLPISVAPVSEFLLIRFCATNRSCSPDT